MPKTKLIPVVAPAALALTALALLAFASEKPRSQNRQAQALIDRVWADRDQDWEPNRLEREIADLEQADRLDPRNHAILSLLAKACFERGMTEEENHGDPARARQFFERGHQSATRALAVKETALAHYLAAINQGAAVARAGIIEQVRSFREIKKHMDWIGKNDPNFHYGAYARFWLDCYQNAPDPVIALTGISKDEACGQLENSIRRQPLFLENHYYKVTACTDPQDHQAYLAALDAALDLDPKALTAERSSNEYFHRTLRKLWKAKTGKDHP